MIGIIYCILMADYTRTEPVICEMLHEMCNLDDSRQGF